jgi:hypothetical protein
MIDTAITAIKGLNPELVKPFQRNLGSSGLYRGWESNELKGRGKRSAFSVEEAEEKIDAAVKETQKDKVQSGLEAEAGAGSKHSGGLGAIYFEAMGDEMFLMTIPPPPRQGKRQVKPTEFKIPADSPIIQAASEAATSGDSDAESKFKKRLNLVAEQGGLKNEIISIIDAEYERLMNSKEEKYPKKRVNLSNFRVTDIVGLFESQIDVTEDERKKYEDLKAGYLASTTQPKRQKKLLAQLSAMSGKSNYEDAITYLEPIYGREQEIEGLEEIFNISEDQLRRLLS